MNIKLISLLFFLFTYYSVFAGTENIAGDAKVTASTSLNNHFSATNVNDGVIGVDGMGEWACEGVTTDWGYVRFPWIKLEWNEPKTINRILLFDRPSASEHIASGKLVFSDGSIVFVNQIPTMEQLSW